jgi:hypothetical protein
MSKPLMPPTVGRKVWYRPSDWDRTGPGAMQVQTGEPLDATIVAVNSDHNVNLVVFDAAGFMHRRLSVTLLHDGPATAQWGKGAAYAEWMPYQRTQAAKHAEAEPA